MRFWIYRPLSILFAIYTAFILPWTIASPHVLNVLSVFFGAYCAWFFWTEAGRPRDGTSSK